jgi:hypothetical protein
MLAEEVSSPSVKLSETDLVKVVSELKCGMAKKFVTRFNSETVHAVRSLEFTPPAPRVCGRRSSSGSTGISETPNSDAGLESPKLRATPLGEDGCTVAPCRERDIQDALLLFEEKCILLSLLPDHKMKAFRSLNRGVLGKVLEHFTLFKHQHSLLIAINILMFNSSKMRIPKDSFKDLVSELFQRNEKRDLSINFLKETRPYALIKEILRSLS